MINYRHNKANDKAINKINKADFYNFIPYA